MLDYIGLKHSCHVKMEKERIIEVDVIRREILKMFGSNQLVTLWKLNLKLQSDCSNDISKSTLWKIVRVEGFTFRKTLGGRNVICEKTTFDWCSKQIRERRRQGMILYI
jgi:hypothetical protein